MSLQAPRDFFLHELSDTYSAEQQIVKLLPTLVTEAGDSELGQALKDHEQETKQQIKNLDEVFKLLSETPEAMVCRGAEGLKREHDDFVKEQPAPQILSLFVAGAAGKTEHYEIESYRGLVDMAKLLGERDCAKLLEANLKQEEAMAKTVEAHEKRLVKQLAAEANPNSSESAKKRP